jgi:hypothetical protein
MDHARTRCDPHVISPLRQHHNVRFRHRLMSLEPYVSPDPGGPQTVKIRGGADVTVMANSARRYVDAPHKQRCVVALQEERETADRSIVASDLSWRTLAMVQGSPLRWLVEVCLEDWQSSAGWGQLTTQPDEEGSSRRLILRLRLDHGLRCHPHPRARLEHQLPACTVGSLHATARADILLACIRARLFADNSPRTVQPLEPCARRGVATGSIQKAQAQPRSAQAGTNPGMKISR